MPFHSPSSPSACPITQEAESTRYARDTFRLRLLSTGHLALYDSTGTYLGAVDTIHEIFGPTEHLRLLASRDRMEAEAQRHALLHRAAEAEALASIDIEI